MELNTVGNNVDCVEANNNALRSTSPERVKDEFTLFSTETRSGLEHNHEHDMKYMKRKI